VTKSGINEAKIREAAYFIWLSEGQPDGRDAEHWTRAVKVLEAAEPQPKKTRAAKAKPRAARKTPAARGAKAKAPAASKKSTKS